MPPAGVKKGTKRARQYEHIKESQLDQGTSEDRAEEIAARTVNKERARSGESRQRSQIVDERHVLRAAAAAGAPAPTAPRAAPAISSTTRPGSSTSTGARR